VQHVADAHVSGVGEAQPRNQRVDARVRAGRRLTRKAQLRVEEQRLAHGQRVVHDVVLRHEVGEMSQRVEVDVLAVESQRAAERATTAA
jgi:hypothetical protein